MQKVNELSSAWQQWLHANVARGCSPESLVESMVGESFDPVFARQAVSNALAVPQALASSSPPAPPAIAGNGVGPQFYIEEPPRIVCQGNVIHTDDRVVHLSFQLAQPVVVMMDDLLTMEECDELVRLSAAKLKRSTIVDPLTGTTSVIDERSSYGTFFKLNEDAFIAKLDRRIAQAMNCPVENGEGLQILHYDVGAQYKPHFDYFAPADPGSQAHLARGGQRVSTLVIYLNHVEAGGGTVFPELGLTVVPKKGAAVYFEYFNRHGQVDARSLHGGTPVESGEKWIATKWVRERRYE